MNSLSNNQQAAVAPGVNPGGVSVPTDAHGLAHHYLGQGFAILPIHGITDTGGCTCGKDDCTSPGKHPVLPGGCNAPITAEQIGGYYDPEFPMHYNIGIATGPSTLLVLDIDPRHNGPTSLRQMEERLGALPETVTAATGGGGLHLLFVRPASGRFTNKANIGKDLLGGGTTTGVDVRAEGGYIVAPPSRHISGGSYRWLAGRGPGERALAQLPDAWLAYLDADARRSASGAAGAVIQAQEAHGAVTDTEMGAAHYANARAACAFLAHAEAHAASLSEGEWFAQASNVIRCVDGERIFTEISKTYPNASEREIAQKIERSRQFGKPHTCAYIEADVGFADCATCPHRGRVKAPVQLGRMSRRERAEAALAMLEPQMGSATTADAIEALLRTQPDIALCDETQVHGLVERLSRANHLNAKVVGSMLTSMVKDRRRADLSEQATKNGFVVYQKEGNSSAHYSDILVDRLAQADPPKLYLRQGQLARVLPPLEEGGPQRVEELTDRDLARSAITRAVPFVVISSDQICPIDPPEGVMSDLLHRGVYPGVPVLKGTRRSPIVRVDCTVCTTPGYDRASGYLYDPPASIAGLVVPQTPSMQQVQDARTCIEDLLADFPVKPGDCSRTHMVAAMLTLAMRTAIDGPVPMVVIEAPYRGSGKTLLAQVISLVVLGEESPAVAISRDDEEIRKSIMALQRTSPEYLLFDNVTAAQATPQGWNPQPFQSLLTSGAITDRILGSSTVTTVKSRALLVVTGNDMRLGDDLARRSVFIQLHPATDQPTQRDPSTFRHPDIVTYIRQNRKPLLGALLTMVQGWVAAGAPRPARVPMASFERWAGIVGGVLEFVGYRDFLGNAAVMATRGHTEHQQWCRFYAALFRCFMSDGAKRAQLGYSSLVQHCPKPSDWSTSKVFTISEIPTALNNGAVGDDVYPSCFRRELDSSGRKLVSALGAALKSKNGIRYGSLKLVVLEDTKNGINRYRLEAADDTDPRILQDLFEQISLVQPTAPEQQPVFMPDGSIRRVTEMEANPSMTI